MTIAFICYVLVEDHLYLLVVNGTKLRDLLTHINASQKRNKALANPMTHQCYFFTTFMSQSPYRERCTFWIHVTSWEVGSLYYYWLFYATSEYCDRCLLAMWKWVEGPQSWQKHRIPYVSLLFMIYYWKQSIFDFINY